MLVRALFVGTVLLFLATVSGCGGEASIALEPPEGWQAEGVRWWKTGLDTSGVFRDLETLAAMDVTGTEVTYLASPQLARRSAGAQAQFERLVKRSLIPLYRNQPELVDSLFERYVTPELQEVTLDGDLKEYVDEYKRRGYKLLHAHFREPVMASKLGEDVPVDFPDSLKAYQGRVRLQAYLNQEGEPVALTLLEGLHPVLDAIALRASTQVRWRPAYQLRKGRWVALPSWSRFSVRFQ